MNKLFRVGYYEKTEGSWYYKIALVQAADFEQALEKFKTDNPLTHLSSISEEDAKLM